MTASTRTLVTDRLVLRGWRVADAAAAFEVYGSADVARWFSPDMDRVPDRPEMRVLIENWVTEDHRLGPYGGRWAIERADDHRVIGGASLMPLPPGEEDLGLDWQLNPALWRDGYAEEATIALAHWAFHSGAGEIFAVVRPDNTRATATIRQHGMHLVGDTDKYFGLEMQVFRLRPADLA